MSHPDVSKSPLTVSWFPGQWETLYDCSEEQPWWHSQTFSDMVCSSRTKTKVTWINCPFSTMEVWRSTNWATNRFQRLAGIEPAPIEGCRSNQLNYFDHFQRRELNPRPTAKKETLSIPQAAYPGPNRAGHYGAIQKHTSGPMDLSFPCPRPLDRKIFTESFTFKEHLLR